MIQLIQTQFRFIKQMKSGRPDSAKSTHTRLTVDSEISSNHLNLSKFSETYSNGVNNNIQKKNDFHKYVSEKSKDPKFKKYLNNNLPEIPEKSKQSQEQSKLASKPFQKRVSKLKQQKQDKKIQEKYETTKQSHPGVTTKQNLKSGKSFVQRNKQKLNSLKMSSSTKMEKEKVQIKQGKKEEHDDTYKPQITFEGFTVKQVGKQPRKIQNTHRNNKQNKTKQQVKEEKQSDERQHHLNQLSQFIEEVQNRNVQYYPSQYQQFVRKNESKVSDIQKINIDEFEDEPSERDYQALFRKINSNEKKIMEDSGYQNQSMRSSVYSEKSSSSLNLDEIIDGTNQEDTDQKKDDASVISSMTASQFKDRNMFLTEILKGRITKEQLQQLKQNDETHMKLAKFDGNQRKKQQNFSDEEVQMVKINMSKKKTTKIIQKNKIEAAGQLYRQCDFLSPEQQKRIQELINQDEIYSPFVASEMQVFRNRRIDEGISLYRAHEEKVQEEVINQAALPKDPVLRKQTQMKILREKISSVNNRLRNADEVVVNKNKIQVLVNTLKDRTPISKYTELMIKQKNKEHQQQSQKIKEAQEIISWALKQRQSINTIMEDLSSEFVKMEGEVKRIREMDVEQLRQQQLKQLNEKRKNAVILEIEIKQFEKQIQNFQRLGEQMKQNLQRLNDITDLVIPKLECQDYKEGETIEDLDRIISGKWKQSEKKTKEEQDKEIENQI